MAVQYQTVQGLLPSGSDRLDIEPFSDHQKLFTEFSTQIERKSTGITIRQREPLRLMHGMRTHYRVPGVHEDVFSTVSFKKQGVPWER